MTTKECRICYENEKDSSEELIYPCRCDGTSKYIHLECLEKWRNMNKGREAYLRCLECLADYSIKREFPTESYKYDMTLSNGEITGFLFYNLVVMSLGIITPSMDIDRNIPQFFFSKKLSQYLKYDDGSSILFYFAFVSFTFMFLNHIFIFTQLQYHIKKRKRYWLQAFFPYMTMLVMNSHFLLGFAFNDSHLFDFYLYMTSLLSLLNPLSIIFFIKTHNDIIYYLNNVKNKYKIMNYTAKSSSNIILTIRDSEE